MPKFISIKGGLVKSMETRQGMKTSEKTTLQEKNGRKVIHEEYPTSAYMYV